MALIEQIPVVPNPDLLDKVIAEIQRGLVSKLPWLDHAFGKCQRLVRTVDKRRFYSPNVYAGGNEYIDVSPNDQYGNFSFFHIEDPQQYEWIPNQIGAIRVNAGLIFWFDFRKVSPGSEYRNIEAIKKEILQAVNGGFHIRFGRVRFGRIYEQAENIYRGFSLDEIKNQFLMHPFAGLRFDGELFLNENC